VLAAAEREHGDGYVEAILTDPRKYVRIYAIRELGRRREARAVNALVARLWDEDFLTRLYSARSLAQIGNEDARRNLFDAFRRAWTAQTRYDRRDESITPENLDTLSREAAPLRELSESLFLVGPAAVEPLLSALRDGSESAIDWTIVPLGALGAVDAVPLMLDRISEESHGIRTQAREAIFRIGPRALPLLMERENHGSELARELVHHLIRVFHNRAPEWAEGPPDIDPGVS
jgi:HEAT repeat protein